MYLSLIILTIVSCIISLAYASIALKSNSDSAYYAFVRSIAVLAVVIVAVFSGNQSVFYINAFLMALIQLGDAIVGVRISDKLKTYGPLTVSIVSFILLAMNIYS